MSAPIRESDSTGYDGMDTMRIGTWEREDGFENMGELLAEWRKTRRGKGRE